jgi:type IV secretory pathway VirB4 component
VIPRSRQIAHRATTAHLQSIYPFVAEGGLGGRGVYIGRDLFGGAFTYDPWELYGRGLLTSPNMLVAGQVGRGKSAFVKSYLWRQQAFGRRAIVMDPKGEYGALAEACGVEPIRLYPGGNVQINPLDRRVAQEEQLRLLQAISAAALDRPLQPQERVALERALVAASSSNREPTLPDVVEALLRPKAETASEVASSERQLSEWGRQAAFELRRLCEGDLRGMFDQQTSASIDLDASLVVLDLSSVYGSDALGILMTCAAAWLQGILASGEKDKRIFVLDEAWAILSHLGIAKWLQSSFKLSRSYGLQNVAVVHRLSDLSSTGAGESQEVRITQGLLSDAETRVVYGQATDQVELSKRLLGLTDTEASLLPQLERGLALWKVGQRSFLVYYRLGSREIPLVDTDARMRVARLEEKESASA